MAKANMSPTKNPMPTQDPIVRAKNFDEVALGYDEKTAIDEAMRCLNCKTMPCVSGCPVNIRIPEFIAKIKECDWRAGQFLYEQLKENKLKLLVGENTKVLMLTKGEELLSFCTLAEKDDIQPTDLTPWIGWVYTFPEYRGHRYSEKLLSYAEELAKVWGMDNVYISTNHIGLYEKFGYKFFATMKDIDGEDSRVYTKRI